FKRIEASLYPFFYLQFLQLSGFILSECFDSILINLFTIHNEIVMHLHSDLKNPLAKRINILLQIQEYITSSRLKNSIILFQ
ncbi:MAG: hypothetical protein ACXADW_18870, partial [Candidatus Hodarchaeales archaeon]